AELWQESGRWRKYGPELLRFKDRHERDFCVGPTHEEVITDIARREIRSYRQLPLHFYQIQTKFRDEIRPRFGVMRGREFTMKDGYSFHADYTDLQREYRNMYDTYTRIFVRLGLKFRAVAGDPGAIGGTESREFHVLAESGEDAIAYCPQSEYAANVELAEAVAPKAARSAPTEKMRKVATPDKTRCEDVANLLGVPIEKTVKAIAIVREEAQKGASGSFAMLLVRGDHDLNEIKTQKVIGTFRFAKDEEIERGIEVGHIFQLRTQYSESMKATFLDEAGNSRPFEMGCYGMGITRIVAAAIEQNHDEHGIVFPQPIAPFHVALVPIGYGKSAGVRDAADSIYRVLTEAGFEVLLDDRDERPGVMFADMELIGIPHRIVVGERSLKDG